MIKCSINNFVTKLESVEYNAAWAMTNAILGTNTENPYQEYGQNSYKIDVSWEGCFFLPNI